MKKIVFPQPEIGLAVKGLMFQCKIPCLLLNPGKMIPEKWSRKNGPREKWSSEKLSPKNGPRKNGPRKKWSPENWSPTNSETKNRGVGVEHRGLCVCGMLGCNQSTKTQNSTTNPKHGNKKSWGARRASWCVCGMFGCDQSMKTQNSTTNLPGIL